MKPVLMNDFKMQWEQIKNPLIEAVNRVGTSGHLILGPEVSLFEKKLSEFWGINHTIGCANGMDAIEIGLRCLGIKSGDKVVTTPLSAFATTLAILKVGAVPIFIDVDQNGLIDLDLVDDFLFKNDDVKYLIPVHLFGHCLDMEKLSFLKNKYDLKIVEDCAQSIGSNFNSISCGAAGQMTATSFYPTKNLGCYGDGGALLTNDLELYNLSIKIRDYGQSQKYVHSHLGLNSRLDELQAAILSSALLPNLADWTNKRKNTAEKYLSKINNDHLLIPKPPSRSNSVWHLFPLMIGKNRENFINYLKQNGIASGIHYPILIPDQPIFFNSEKSDLKYEIYGKLTNAKYFSLQEVSIPIHPFLTPDEIEKVILVCNEWKG